MKQGLLDIPSQKIPVGKLFEGLRDTLLLLTDTLKENDIQLLEQFTMELESACNADLVTGNKLKKHLQSLEKNFHVVYGKLNNDPGTETFRWKHLV